MLEPFVRGDDGPPTWMKAAGFGLGLSNSRTPSWLATWRAEVVTPMTGQPHGI